MGSRGFGGGIVEPGWSRVGCTRARRMFGHCWLQVGRETVDVAADVAVWIGLHEHAPGFGPQGFTGPGLWGTV
jgi:hypothetical protein